MNDLTINQEKYVQELIKGKTQRKAYRAAYPQSKRWKDKTVDEKACRLWAQDKIQTRYKEIKDKIIEIAERETIITATEIIQEIVDIARGDIGNHLDFRTEKIVSEYDEGEPVFSYETILDIKDSRDTNTKNVQEISLSAEGTFKLKMYRRDLALYKLAEIFGLDAIKEEKLKISKERLESERKKTNRKYW